MDLISTPDRPGWAGLLERPASLWAKLKGKKGNVLIQIAPAGANRNGAEITPLQAPVKIGTRKRLLIRAIEFALRPIVWIVDRWRPGYPATSDVVERILVLEYWNLGDTVMELPFLENLRTLYPDAHITLLTSPKCVPLIADQGLVDELLVVRVPWAQHYSRWRKYNPFSLLWIELFRMLKSLHSRHFDLAFTARADIRENFILWLANVRRRVGYATGGAGFLLTDQVSPDLDRPHFSSRWLRLLEHLGKQVFTRQPRLRLKQEDRDWASQSLDELGVKDDDLVIAVHPGARSAIRQWGDENFIALIDRLLAEFPVKILWFQDPGQQAPGPKRNRVFPLSLPLRQFMAIVERCDLMVCNDSGPMHIATALDIKVVGIFGPTEPTWFGPLGKDHHVVIRSEFGCRPCFDYCIFDEPKCLRLITVESVYEVAVSALRTIYDAIESNKSAETVSGAFSHVEQATD